MKMSKIKTIDELLALAPEEVNCDLGVLVGSRSNHVPEAIDENVIMLWELEKLGNSAIEIKYYKNHFFDHRRFWRLASVWFENKPFMVIQNAGREGDDYSNRFIIDTDVYSKAILHLKILIASQPVEILQETKERYCDRDSEIETLTDFYGNELNGYFERY